MPDSSRKARSPQESQTETTEIVLPQHANAIGTAFGGSVLSWIDICAAISAQRHCSGIAVTAAIDEVQFLAPIRVGDVVRVAARVNAAFRTSLEIGVAVDREHPFTRERARCVDALLTFVHVDADGNPQEVPPLACESDEDRVREKDAHARRQQRLMRKQQQGSMRP